MKSPITVENLIKKKSGKFPLNFQICAEIYFRFQSCLHETLNKMYIFISLRKELNTNSFLKIVCYKKTLPDDSVSLFTLNMTS